VGQKGISCIPAGGGPGAYLRYRAGGAGSAASFPGSGTPADAIQWQTALGRNWSHDYAQRIVVNNPAEPNVDFRIGHAWLITRAASFREFKNPAAGGGLRLYALNAPSDESRRLYYDTASGGWEMIELDGTRHIFRSDGLWTQTIDAANPTHPTTASYTGTQLDSVTKPDGTSETFTYSGGRLATITEVAVAGSGTASRVWTYTWNGADLSFISRPDGTKLEFTYAAPGLPGYLSRVRLIGTDGTSGRVVGAFEYNSNGYLTKSWQGDPVSTGPDAVDQQTLTYTNLPLPTAVQVTDALNVVTDYTMDRDPRSIKPRIKTIAGECTACGLTPSTTFEYTNATHPMRVSGLINARGFRTNNTYTAFGQIATRTEAVGTADQRLTTWTYDAVSPGLVTQVEQPSTTAGQFRRTQMAYNATTSVLNTRTITGRESGAAFSHATAMTHNASGRPLTIDPPGYAATDITSFTYAVPNRNEMLPDTRTDPLIGTTTFGYDGFNRRTSTTDVNGVETTTTYDLLDRVVEVRQKGAIPADDLVTGYEYNLFKDLIRVTLPKGNVIEYAHDSAGRMIRTERRLNPATPGERTAYTLDKIGNRTLEDLQRWDGATFVSESKTEYVYSSRCHLDKIIRGKDSPTPSTTEHCYDKNSNLEKVWDANHPSASQTAPPTQSYTYDALDRLLTSSQPFGGAGGGNAVTSYLYDVQDHLRQVTDAEGNVTSYTTGDRDLMTQQVSPVSGTTNYTFNEHGQLVTTTDARNIAVTRTIDALDRVTKEDYPDSRLDTDFVYDGGPGGSFFKGRLRTITRAGETIAYDYDRFGRMLQDGTLFYQYDKNGNRTQTTYPSGLAATTTYDFADRPLTLTAVGAGLASTSIVTTAAYKPSGPLTGLTLGNGLVEQRLYDQRYYPDRITVPTGIDWDYTVDNVGNITTIADGGTPRTYAYQDFQYFLTQGAGPWPTSPLTWTYDKIGNRLTETRAGILTDTYNYVTNGTGGRNPKLQNITLANGAGSRMFRHDQIGDETITSDPQQEHFRSYDAAGKLTRLFATVTRAESKLRYDGRGFLAEAKQEITACNPLGQKPTYSSAGVLMQRRQYMQLTPATAISEDAVLYFAGRPIATVKTAPGAAVVTFVTTDHLGTPMLTTNAASMALWSGGFEPFGADWGSAESSGVFLRFPGQWSDPAWSVSEGLMHNVARNYSPGTGRYERPDPLGLWDGPNVFGYVGANPLTGIDPLGLTKWSCTSLQYSVAAVAGIWVGWLNCESECRGNSKIIANLRTGLIGFGIGVQGSLPGAVGVVDIDDGLDGWPTPGVLGGPTCYGEVGASVFSGGSYSGGFFGGGFSPRGPSPSGTVGAGGFYGCGSTKVTGYREVPCCAPPPRPEPIIRAAPPAYPIIRARP
jgi:RHS repeat-associated protein